MRGREGICVCVQNRGFVQYVQPLLFVFQLPQQLAPENTAMSFEKAVEAGSLGLEADVTIR